MWIRCPFVQYFFQSERSTELSINYIDNESTISNLPDEQIQERVAHWPDLLDNQRNQLVQLLVDFRDIFSDRPGLNQLCV